MLNHVRSVCLFSTLNNAVCGPGITFFYEISGCVQNIVSRCCFVQMKCRLHVSRHDLLSVVMLSTCAVVLFFHDRVHVPLSMPSDNIPMTVISFLS